MVENIDEPAKYASHLKILGEKHIMYEADPNFLQQMGFMFLAAIQPILEQEVIRPS